MVKLARNMALPKHKIALIVANFIVFVGVLAVNYQSRSSSVLFPKETGQISRKYPTELTPASSTFLIWAFIYSYQVVWLIYSLTVICRNVADILPGWFYGCFMCANVCNFIWLLVWSREYLHVAFAVLTLNSVALNLTLYFAYTGLYRYLSAFPKDGETPSRVDIWCIRLLVQNGVIFYNTWVTIAACINLNTTLTYDINVAGTKAATGSLVVLFVIISVWFVMENFVFKKYTRFTFSEYIVLIVGLSGIVKKHWTDGHGNQGFVMFLLVLSVILFIARIIIIVVKERQTSRSESHNMNFKTAMTC